jgi:hypothetical protein
MKSSSGCVLSPIGKHHGNQFWSIVPSNVSYHAQAFPGMVILLKRQRSSRRQSSWASKSCYLPSCDQMAALNGPIEHSHHAWRRQVEGVLYEYSK